MQAGIDRLRRKSILLTSYLEIMLKEVIGTERMEIFTPADPEQRGCQLSICFLNGVESEIVNKMLGKLGVICDERKPNVMRIAPTPLYNSFMDIFKFIQCLKDCLLSLQK